MHGINAICVMLFLGSWSTPPNKSLPHPLIIEMDSFSPKLHIVLIYPWLYISHDYYLSRWNGM